MSNAISDWIGDSQSGAVFNEKRTHRFTLWRRWTGLFDDGPCPVEQMLAFICLNPSTADEHHNDPTVSRGINFAKQWGLSGFIMLNLFGFRATEPRDMKAADSPIGSLNDSAIQWVATRAARVVCAWGNHGTHLGRDDKVKQVLKESGVHPECFVLTKKNQPRHPLYVRSDSIPIRFEIE